MYALSAKEIHKSYGRIQALRGLSFEVEHGEIYGIIGPDGAGKTTLFRILTTLLLADSGTATIEGLDVVKDYREIRKIIGYMPGRFSLYQDLSVKENLNFFATVFHTTLKENYHLIEPIYKQIEPFNKRKAGKLSGGMKQKLALCCALIHKPRLLFLDEPTTGVDPVSRKDLWNMLLNLKKQGMSIIASTPYMDEARLCDRIALILDGNFLSVDTPAAIIARYPEILWSVKGRQMHRLLEDLHACPDIKSAFSFGDVFHITVQPSLRFEALQAYLSAKGHDDISIQRIEPTVEDCFMLLSKKEK